MEYKRRITYRNTKGKPGFKDVLEGQIVPTVKKMQDMGYTMIHVNPPRFK